MISKTGEVLWIDEVSFGEPIKVSGWARTRWIRISAALALTGAAALGGLVRRSPVEIKALEENQPLLDHSAVPNITAQDAVIWDDMIAPDATAVSGNKLTARATAGRLLLVAGILASMVLLLALVFDIGSDISRAAAGLVSCG